MKKKIKKDRADWTPSKTADYADGRAVITIEAPQGWGKGWLALQLAREIAAWRGGSVSIDRGDGPAEVVGEPYSRRVAVIRERLGKG